MMSKKQSHSQNGKGRTAALNQSESKQQPKSKSRWLRWLTRILGFILSTTFLLVLIILGLVAWVLYTESGLKFAINTAKEFAPGELVVEGVQGRIAGPLSIERFAYKDDTTNIQGNDISLDWQPRALISGQVLINSFKADTLELAFAASETEEESSELPDIDLPLDFSVEQLAVSKLIVHPPAASQASNETGDQASKQVDLKTIADEQPASQQQPIIIHDILLIADAAGRDVELGELSARYEDVPVQLKLAGGVSLGDGYPVDLTADWTLASEKERPKYAGRIVVKGTLADQLQGDLILQAPNTLQANYQLVEPMGDLRWQVDLNTPAAALNTWLQGLPEWSAGVALQANGDLAAANIERLKIDALQGEMVAKGRLGWSNDSGQPVEWDMQITGRNVNPKVLVDNEMLAGQVNWQADIQGYLDTNNQPQLTANFSQLKAAFDANKAYQSKRSASTATASATARIPDINGSADLKLAGEQLTINSLRLKTLQGVLSVTGNASLGDTVAWNTRINVRNINPTGYLRSLNPSIENAIVTLTAQVNGKIRNDDVEVLADIQKFQGQYSDDVYKNKSLQAQGKIVYKNDWLDITRLRLGAEETKLTANGRVRIAEPYGGNLTFALKVPTLGDWLPDAQGNINFEGSLIGQGKELRLKAALLAQEFAYTGYDIEKIDLNADIDLNGRMNSVVTADVTEAKLSGMALDTAKLNFAGNASQHQLELTFAMPEAKGNLLLDGSTVRLPTQGSTRAAGPTSTNAANTWTAGGWKGQLQRFNFDTIDLAKWRLNKPLSIQFGGNNLIVSNGCFGSDRTASEICTGGQWSEAEGVDFAGTIKQVPLNLFEPFIPPEYKVSGVLNGDYQFLAPANSPAQGKLTIRSERGEINTRLKTSQTAGFVYRNLELNGVMENDEFKISGGADLAEDGEAKATTEINIGLKDKMPIDGRIFADINRLAVVSVFVPQLSDVRGAASVDITLGGTINEPTFDGFAEIDAKRADVIPLGSRIEDLYARVDASGGGVFTLKGEFLAGKGALDFNGEIKSVDDSNPGGAGWLGTINVQGEKVELLRTPDMKGTFSPKLQLDIDGETLKLNGELYLYDTELKLKRYASIVRESSDVVIVGEIPTDEDSVEKLDLGGTVTIVMGDPLSVVGEGLEAEVTGRLSLDLRSDDLPLGRGELKVNGNFSAYGQDLNFENSRIVFADVEVSNPSLYVEAVRYVKDVTAGLRITGTANSPQIKIFSVPAMTESEALAYLILGRPLDDSTSTNDGNSLNAAASAIGVAGGNVLSEWVGGRLGIDQVGFESGDGGQIDFVLGKQLGQKLFVNFRQSLFDPVSSLQLQYLLNKRCDLAAEASTTGQGVDVTCSFERD